MAGHLVTRLIYAQRKPGIGPAIRALLRFKGTDVPPQCLVGEAIQFPHCAVGVVLHEDVRLGDHVTVFQNVTIGRADIWQPKTGQGARCDVGAHAVLCAGAAILPRDGLTIGAGAVVGANAVVLESVPAWEIWAGNPAKRVGERSDAVRRAVTGQGSAG